VTCPACGLTNPVSARRCDCGHVLASEDDLEIEVGARLRRDNRLFALLMLLLFATGLAACSYACNQINTGAWLLM
jgi:hypothetical protein